MKNFAPCLLALLLLRGLSAFSADILPDGWRLPTKRELAEEERLTSSNRFAIAAGDFNGDGIRDKAYLVKRKDSTGEGLIVRLSRGSEGFEWVTLSEFPYGAPYPDAPMVWAIEAMPPGTYEYFCMDNGKENDCDKSVLDRSKLTTLRTAIRYLAFDKEETAFYWDKRRKLFLHILFGAD